MTKEWLRGFHCASAQRNSSFTWPFALARRASEGSLSKAQKSASLAKSVICKVPEAVPSALAGSGGGGASAVAAGGVGSVAGASVDLLLLLHAVKPPKTTAAAKRCVAQDVRVRVGMCFSILWGACCQGQRSLRNLSPVGRLNVGLRRISTECGDLDLHSTIGES